MGQSGSQSSSLKRIFFFLNLWQPVGRILVTLYQYCHEDVVRLIFWLANLHNPNIQYYHVIPYDKEAFTTVCHVVCQKVPVRL